MNVNNPDLSMISDFSDNLKNLEKKHISKISRNLNSTIKDELAKYINV